ncbi:MAG: hypothetical protein ACPGRF_06445, partial [Miltoncostaeaceae bacterium]
ATVLVATEEFARANPAATRALVRASARAVARADAAPRAVALRFNDLLDESTGTRLDRGVLLEALDGTHASTAVAPGAMERMVRAADSAGYAGGPVAPAALVPRAG